MTDKKEIKDYLHLYIGCKCHLLDYKNGEPKEFQLTVYNLNYYRDWISYIRPILRPLSSMVEGEAKEMAEMRGIKKVHFKRFEFDHGNDRIDVLYFNMQRRNIEWVYIFLKNLTPDQFRFFLSKSFDQFGLIDAGLAIDSTKTNQP